MVGMETHCLLELIATQDLGVYTNAMGLLTAVRTVLHHVHLVGVVHSRGKGGK